MKAYAFFKLFLAFSYLFRDIHSGASIGVLALAVIFVFFAVRRVLHNRNRLTTKKR